MGGHPFDPFDRFPFPVHPLYIWGDTPAPVPVYPSPPVYTPTEGRPCREVGLYHIHDSATVHMVTHGGGLTHLTFEPLLP